MTPSSGHIRIGMLTPSSNTVVEPYTCALLAPLFPHVTAHFSRFTVTRIALDAQADAQFTLAPILTAARLLMDARMDVIAWNGTSAAWLGLDQDEALCASIARECDVTSTSAVLSLMEIFRRRGINRIGLVTPYTGDVQSRIIDNFRKYGIETAAAHHAGLTDNFSFCDMQEDTIADLCRQVAGAKPQAIVILCTNMRGPLIAAGLERELGIAVLDSVAFTLWGCLDAAGVDMTPLGAFGSLFAGQMPKEHDFPSHPSEVEHSHDAI
jgi:maleate isomerase